MPLDPGAGTSRKLPPRVVPPPPPPLPPILSGKRVGMLKPPPTAPVPKPKDLRSADTRERARTVRQRNVVRGAAPTGGLGRKESARFEQAAKRATKPTGEHVRALQQVMVAQGHAIKVDGIWGPQSQRAFEQSAQAVGRQRQQDLRRRANAILRAPEDATTDEKVQVFGFAGATALEQARRRALAETVPTLEEPPTTVTRPMTERDVPFNWNVPEGAVVEEPNPVLRRIPNEEQNAIWDSMVTAIGPENLEQSAKAGHPVFRWILEEGTGAAALERAIEQGRLTPELAFEVAATVPFIRGPKAMARAAEVIAAGGTKEEAQLAARAAMREPGPIRQAITGKAPPPPALSTVHGRALNRAIEAQRRVEKQRSIVRRSSGEQKKAAEKELARTISEKADAVQDELYARLWATIDTTPVDPTDARHAGRQQVAKQVLKTMKGRKGALPATAKTPLQMQRLMSFLDELAEQGQHGRMWYETSSQAIKELAGHDVVKAERYAQLLAIYSPQQQVLGNTSMANRAWNEFHVALDDFAADGRITVGQEWQRGAAERVLSGRGDWNGRKTNNFYVNFLEDINKERFDELVRAGEIRPDGVTVDLWMGRVFGYTEKQTSITQGRYDVIEPIVRQLADERGWKPKQMQAALWTAVKAASIDSSANIDFSSAFARHFGQFNFEAAPGAAAAREFHDAYGSWPPAVQEKFLEENGRLVDNFLDEVGVLHRAPDMGAGVYAGPSGVEFNPALSLRMATSSPPGGGARGYQLHPADRQMIERAAAAIGRALEQDSVAWHRPAVALATVHADSGYVALGRAATPDEARQLYLTLNPDPGDPRFIVMNATDGLVVKNISDVPNAGKRRAAQLFEVGDESFHGLTERAVEQTFRDLDVEIQWSASDGGLVESGDYGRHLETGDTGGSGQGVRFLESADRLRDEARSLRERYVEAFGGAGVPGRGLAERVEERSLRKAEEWLQSIDAGLRAVGRNTAIGSGAMPFMDQLEDVALREARGLDMPYRARTLTSGELTVQVPRARGLGLRLPDSLRISRLGERLVDRASDTLDRRLVRETPVARIVTTAERATKAAGRLQRRERLRRQAEVAQELKTIAKVDEGSVEDIAHYWYAQLPATHRNADGLEAVRAMQLEEAERISSGQALEELNTQKDAISAALREAETGGEAGRLLRQRQEVDVIISDLPTRLDDIAASVAVLDRVIAAAPPVNEQLMASLRRLSLDRGDILVRAGRLAPERAAAREGLLARHLGVEPDGSEIYMGHRTARPEEFGSTYGATGGTGRPTSPKSMTRNRMILASTGRVRPSVYVGAEDWQSAQVFEEAIQARDDLAKLGTKFNGRSVPKGYVLVNPKGRVIPSTWKTDELAQFTENADEVEELVAKAKDITDGWFAQEPGQIEMLKAAAAEQGVDWGELRVVPKRLVDRYYAQYRSAAGVSAPGRAYDLAVDAVAASLVFARVGYVPKNVVQNLIMALPHQGAFLPVNAARAGQVMRDPELLALLRAEVSGSSASAALAREASSKRVLGKAAEIATKLADDPARISAFLHEAAAEGVISKVNPLLTGKDRAQLVRLLTDRRHRPLLNDITSRTVDAMADFTRLTPTQARMARRFLVIPGWLMAGSRYPFHFAATHPIRTALLAYIALGEPGAPDELRFNEPVTHYFEGERYLQGIPTPWGRWRTGSLNPVTTPYEIAASVVGSVKGKENPFDFTQETAWDYAQPLASSAVAAFSGQGFRRAGRRLAPNLTFVQDMISPTGRSRYPEDATRLGRLKREVGIIPIEINDPEKKGGGGGDRFAPLPGGGRGFAPMPGSK